MTYRGSFQSGFGSQNGEQWPNQSGVQNYGSPSQSQYHLHNQNQRQYSQFQSATFAPVGYPQQPMQATNFAPAHANNLQTVQTLQTFESPSFGQQYPSNMGQGQSAAQRSQYVHHTPQQQRQYPQQMGWQQQMPPPNASPVTPYQQTSQLPPIQSQQPQQQFQAQHMQQHRQPTPQRVNSPHINSPVMAQSSQYPQQFIQNNSRNVSANARRDQVQAGRVSASPRLTSQGLTRSPSVSSTRSPVSAPGLIPHHKDTNSLLVCVAEEFFATARKEVFVVADNPDAQNVQEYQKLVATGLGCLETVLNSNKLEPRLEAKLQLRYATILCEETNNIMEVETALTKGITLCDRYRFHDLKYLMQFLQLKILSQRKGKAAMISVDGRISDAEVLKHYAWAYAFRFFKASLYLQSANPTDVHALDNLKAIMQLAQQRGDTTIFIAACLLEGLSLLKNMKDDAVVRIQGCISQVQKYQFDPSVHVPQLDILALMLDFACSLHQKSPQLMLQKLNALQAQMDSSLGNDSWSLSETEVLFPIKKQPNNHLVISSDTRAVIRPGKEGDNCDYLAMSLWSKIEAYVMTYTYSGLGLMYQNPRKDGRIVELWSEALKSLVANAYKMRYNPTSLQDAIRGAEWRRELKCYLQILRGLHLAAHSRWRDVKSCVEELESLVKPPLDSIIGLYSVYLAGVYHQGTGDLEQADSVYSNPIFNLENYSGRIEQGHGKQAMLDVCLLAAFNRIWIMQHPVRRNDMLTNELLDHLRPYCVDNTSLEIRTAWNLVLAATQTTPPMSMTTTKTHLATAFDGAKALGDIHSISMALNLMRARLFQNIVGDQALKSAKAAASQARKAGNVLWMSVSEGLLSQSYEIHGALGEAQMAWAAGAKYANDALGAADQTSDEATTDAASEN